MSRATIVAMITRKLGALLRGKTTPFQIVAACILGALLGFAPSPTDAPALYVLLVAALLVVNANLGLALLVAGGAKLVSFAAAPISFRVGRFLLDGPTEALARKVVNAPVLAWCGLERYAVAGGLLIALALGAGVGLVIARGLAAFRRRMAAAAQNPSRLREVSQGRMARFTMWLFFGGTGGLSWEQKLERRVGNPVRWWGALLLVLLLGGAAFAHEALAAPIARRSLRAGLEGVNGATVDVGSVELALENGRVAVTGLALADPEALDQDLFRAGRLEADVDQADFLRRRLHVARVVISEAQSGAPRATPGVRTTPPEPPEEMEPEIGLPGVYSLEDVVAEYETWKARLEQAREWLERLSGPPPEEGVDDQETLSERLAREARERGWFGVQAKHLVEEAPTLRLSELSVEGLSATWLPGTVFDLNAQELSTQPALVDAPPRLSLASRDGAIRFEVDLAPASRGGGNGGIRIHWKGLPVDDALARLRLPGAPPLRGGTLDLELDGAWADGRIGQVDLPLRVTFHDTVLALEGIEETSLDLLVLPVGLSGALDAPRIHFDGAAFANAIADAGKRELANQVRDRLEGEFGEALDDLRDRAGVDLPKVDAAGAGEEAKKLLDGVLGGKKKKKED